MDIWNPQHLANPCLCSISPLLDILDVSLGESLAYDCAQCCRLYSKGRVLGHKRSKRNTRPNTSLLQIEGVATKEDAQFYLGKVCRLNALEELPPLNV